MKLRNPSLLMHRWFAMAALSTFALSLYGCSSGSSGSKNEGMIGSSPSSAEAEAAAARAVANTDRVIAELDRSHVIGPTAADQMNYRILWQYSSPIRSPLKGVALRGDSLYTLDVQNFLTRITINDGQRRWRIHAADPVLDVTSLNIVGERAYLTAGSQMLVYDVVNGSPVDKWTLNRVAGTAPVEWEDYLIYGSRGGDLVWLSRRIGFSSQAYNISPTLRVPPVIRGNVIAVVGVKGEVVVLNASTATKYWDKMLLSPVVSRPVIGDEMLYVAGQDQYLWGLDLRTGRATWKYLTQAPLVNSPTLSGDRLYQQVPGTGLMCLNALPIDLPGGESLWVNDKVTGNVILARKGDLFAWDASAQRMFVLDEQRGLTKHRIDLPQASFLTVGGEAGHDLFAASVDGRITRLTPRN